LKKRKKRRRKKSEKKRKRKKELRSPKKKVEKKALKEGKKLGVRRGRWEIKKEQRTLSHILLHALVSHATAYIALLLYRPYTQDINCSKVV